MQRQLYYPSSALSGFLLKNLSYCDLQDISESIHISHDSLSWYLQSCPCLFLFLLFAVPKLDGLDMPGQVELGYLMILLTQLAMHIHICTCLPKAV